MSDSSAYNAGYMAGAIIGVLLLIGLFGMGVVSIIMAFVRRTTGWIVAAIIFSLLGAGGLFTGVVLAARGLGKAVSERSKSKLLVSDDGWVRLEIPGNWNDLPELHESASLKAGNKFREEYAILLSYPKTDFEGTFDEFAQLTSGEIREGLGPDGEAGPIENATAGEFAAKRCRLAGKVNNIRVVYLQYNVETPGGFHQLLMWTLPSKERNAWPVFERVAASFEASDPPKSGALKRTPTEIPRTARTGTVEERVRAIFMEQLGLPAEKVKPDARIQADLGADELDLVELVMASEEEFEIEIGDDDAGKLTTVGEFTEYISMRAKNR